MIQIDFGGSVPPQLTNAYMGSSLSYVTKLQEKFQEQRSLDMYDAKDGLALGELLNIKIKAERNLGKGETAGGVRVEKLFKAHAGLKEAGEKWEWFQIMITKVVENALSLGEDVEKKLNQLEAIDGKKIGQVRERVALREPFPEYN